MHKGEQPTGPRVTVYSKAGCHLCEEATTIVARVCSELSVSWTEIDIGGDPALMHEYGEQIPVTFVDGRQHDYWRVDERRLRSALG